MQFPIKIKLPKGHKGKTRSKKYLYRRLRDQHRFLGDSKYEIGIRYKMPARYYMFSTWKRQERYIRSRKMRKRLSKNWKFIFERFVEPTHYIKFRKPKMLNLNLSKTQLRRMETIVWYETVQIPTLEARLAKLRAQIPMLAKDESQEELSGRIGRWVIKSLQGRSKVVFKQCLVAQKKLLKAKNRLEVLQNESDRAIKIAYDKQILQLHQKTNNDSNYDPK